MKSAWEIERIREFKKLDHNTEADICIIGGGLAGVWSAYLLSKEGKEVILIEKDKVGRAATLYTTAFITQVIDTDLTDLIEMFGSDRARLSWQAGADAIDQIADFIKYEGIECEFVRLPMCSYSDRKRDLDKLHREAAAATRLGFEAGVSHKPIAGFENAVSMVVPNQAKYHPMKFFKALVNAAVSSGVKIYEDTEAVEVSGEDPVIVNTKEKNSIKVRDVIVATYEPLNNPKPTHWKKGMYETYVYELELPKGAIPEMMCEDLRNPYHYFRVDDLGDKMRMIAGGEDHRAELKFEESKSFRALKEFIVKTFPKIEYEVVTRWHGGILEPSDGLSLIGEYAPHQYVASAFSGNGMTYSAITGRILTDLIMERGSEYEELYDPKRRLMGKPVLYKFRDYAEEFLGGAVKNLFK
ncbi:FAD-binding oxidoreductase [Candidatus Parcubacteria bacterium]|nr:FAD-binding oxidoreductase [Candidatus Parcubacteria bacterium]